MATIEGQLAELKHQVVEERESRTAAEKAAADRAEAQQKRHETLKKQHVETMQMFARLMEKQSGQEEQKQQDEQVHEAPVASDEAENPASSTSQDLHRAADSVVPVEVRPREEQSSESGRDRDYGLYGESANTHGSRRSSIHTMKMAPPVSKERKAFQAFLQRVKVYSKYYVFESVLQSEPHLDVGSIQRNVLINQGVSAETYERHLQAWVFFSQVF